MKNQRALGITGLLLILALAPPLWSAADHSPASEKQNAGKAAPPTANIVVSFKLDPRLSGPTYGGEHWISPITYTGSNGQDTVEARAHGVDANGAPTSVSPQWEASDKKMVTVSPIRGDQVKITVHGAGRSKIKLTAQGVSRELLIEGTFPGKYILVTIKQLESKRAAGSTPRQAAAPGKPVPGGTFLAEMDAGKAAQQQRAQKETIARRQQRTLDNFKKKRIEAFQADNGKKAGVVTLPSGLQYKVLKAGKGEKPTDADAVDCHYRTITVEGTEVQSSYHQGQPLTLAVAAATPSWREALKLMPVGSKWQLFVPPAVVGSDEKRPRGRGRRRSSKPALVFSQPTIVELELLAIKGRPRAAERTTAASIIPAR